MELISHIHANATFSSNQQNNSLENLASKQRIFRIVKEQHGFLSDRAIGRLLFRRSLRTQRTISTSHSCAS